MRINIFINDSSDRPWVDYIIGTWKQISRSPVNFEIISSLASNYSDPTILYVHPDCLPSLIGMIQTPCIAIPSVKNTENVSYGTFRIPFFLEEDPRLKGETVSYLKGTGVFLEVMERLSSAKGFILGFDLLFNVFAHLSCLEEFLFESRTQSAPFSLSKNWKNRDWIHKPVVNYYFAILEQMLSLLGIEKKQAFPYTSNFRVCLTHDIDVLDRSVLHTFKQQIFFLLRAGQQLRQWQFRKALNLASTAIQFFWKRCHGWHFNTVLKEERKYGYQSTFNFYAGDRKKLPLFLRLMDPPYNLLQDRRIQTVISQLEECGCEIGLHGSYLSYTSSEFLKNEKENLARIASKPIRSSRQHWLRYSHSQTLSSQKKADLEVDTTLGFNDRPGFRAGIAHPFWPYDHFHQKSSEVLEIPLILMDSHLIDGSSNGTNPSWQSAEAILNEVKKFSGCCSIVWHTHTFESLYASHATYNKLLGWIHQMHGKGMGVVEAASHFQDHAH